MTPKTIVNLKETMQSDVQERPLAIVTGAVQGLGLGMARQLASDGFDIAMVDLHAEADISEEAARFLRMEGRCHRYYRMDISDISLHRAVLTQIQSDYGRLDCLVNNAGIAARPLTDLLDLEPEAFDRSMNINLRGTFFLTQAFARLLIASAPAASAHYRSIIFITSIAAGMVSPDRAQYCTSKAALSMVSKLFAVRLAAHGIHVHEIRPGFMQTAMTASVGNTVIDEWIADGRVPVPRWGQASDIGLAVSAVAQGKLPYMTGQTLWIDGGVSIARAT